MEIKLTINGDEMNVTKIETTENAYAVQSPLTDWAAEQAAKEVAYLAFLSDIKDRLHGAMMDIHEYMTENTESMSDEWKEMYTLTRHIHATIDTVSIFQRHTYPPF